MIAAAVDENFQRFGLPTHISAPNYFLFKSKNKYELNLKFMLSRVREYRKSENVKRITTNFAHHIVLKLQG